MSDHHEVKEAVHQRTLDEPIPKLSLTANGRQIASGSGRLAFGKDQRLSLTVYTKSLPSGHLPQPPPGTLVFPDERPSLQGTTLRGFALDANGLLQETGSGWDPGYAESVYTTHEVRLYTEIPLEGWLPKMDGYIVPSDRFPTNRQSSEGYENSIFPAGLKASSWFEFELDGTRIGLESDAHKAHLRVETRSTQTAVASSEAFLKALSFRMGKRYHWLVYTITGEKRETTVIRCPSGGQGIWYPPLPPFIPLPEREQAETTLLTNATVYFAEDSHEPVAGFLDVCRIASATNFPVESLLIASVLEGLAEYIVGFIPASSCSTSDTETFEELKRVAIQMIQTDPRTCDNPLLPRITARINDANISPHVIKQAAERLSIPLTESELRAWKTIRHPRAHGNFGVDSKDRSRIQSEADQQSCVANLVNKFVLALIGYSGPYVDYSTTGYPTKSFSA